MFTGLKAKWRRLRGERNCYWYGFRPSNQDVKLFMLYCDMNKHDTWVTRKGQYQTDIMVKCTKSEAEAYEGIFPGSLLMVK